MSADLTPRPWGGWRMDAINDAETLHLFAASLPFWPDIRMVKAHSGMFTFAEDLFHAQWCGSRLFQPEYPSSTFVASEAARAAFRACPALRGE